MNEFTVSVGLAYQDTRLPISVREALRDAATINPTAFLLAELATQVDTLEIAVHTGATIDLIGGLETNPLPGANAGIWDHLKWAFLNTPTRLNPLPMATAEPFIALSLGGGIGVGDLDGFDLELSFSQGHFDLLREFSIGGEGNLGNTPGFLPSGAGVSVPLGTAPGNPGTRVFLLKGVGQGRPSGAVEAEYTIILTGETAPVWVEKFASDPEAALTEFFETAGLGAESKQFTDDLSVTDLIAAASGDESAIDKIQNTVRQFDSRCFLAGTPISMWDGSEKPIEEIAPDDIVTSYDKRGKLVPGRVTQTFQNTSKHILDLFGLMVTPGHATFCAEGRFAGRHVPIIDILRSDGALMKQDGTRVRAATGCEVGSEGDQLIQCVVGEKLENGQVSVHEKGQLRAGSRIILSDGSDVALIDLIKKAGATVTDKGMIKAKAGGMAMPFHWRFSDALPKAEDYILARSGVRLEEIYNEGDWEAIGPQLPAPRVITNAQPLETDINLLN